MLKMNTKW